MSNLIDRDKKCAAEAAAALVEPGMTVGLGSGSTAEQMIRALGARVRAGLDVRAIATSPAAETLARAQGIRLTSFEEVAELDLAMDGADEVDPQLRLIKGAGGALLREKIVAHAASVFVIAVDASKLVERLGRGQVPVEVVRFGWQRAAAAVVDAGGQPTLRAIGPGGAPFVTAEGHYILDCRFGPLAAPEALGRALDGIVGVVEHGLFLDLADKVVVGEGGVTRILQRA